MATAPFDVRRAHRWFAVELNNLAWDLVEQPDRDREGTERMIHAAHGACFHWLQVGDLLNHLRAQCLLTTAYARAGLAESALRHAERCLELSKEAGDSQMAWDLAMTHGCASLAFAVAGRLDEARGQHIFAMNVVASFDDPSERSLFERLFPPPPG